MIHPRLDIIEMLQSKSGQAKQVTEYHSNFNIELLENCHFVVYINSASGVMQNNSRAWETIPCSAIYPRRVLDIVKFQEKKRSPWP